VAENVESFAYAVALRSDGRIVAGGTYLPEGMFGGARYLLAGFLPDGRPDPVFNNPAPGIAVSSGSGMIKSIAVQPDGKIVAATGWALMLRYLADGTPDNSFEHDGAATVWGDGGSCNGGLALQSDGRLLVTRDSEEFAVSRIMPDGLPDFTFGTGYVARFFAPVPGQKTMRATVLTVVPGGRVLVGGVLMDRTVTPADVSFVLMRLLPNGTADTTFGDAASPGRSRLSWGSAEYAQPSSIVVLSDGRVLLTGYVSGYPIGSEIALACFTAGGAPDLTFGMGGRVRSNVFPDGGEFALAAGLQSDQTLLVAGNFAGPNDSAGGQILLARYLVPGLTNIAVEYPPGHVLPPGPAPVDFGPVTAGTKFVSVTLRNTGLVTLTNIQAAITGESISGEYFALPPADTTLAPGAETTVLVRLTLSAAPGIRTASLRITAGNTNPPLLPRLISLTGSKATPLQIWRVTWFGSPDNSGAGADENDFDHDGLPNFVEYATRSHPHEYSYSPCQPAGSGTFTYTRPSAALTDFSWTPESAPSPGGPWSSAGLSSSILTDDGVVQTVKVSPAGPAAARLFLRLRVTKI